MSWGNIEAVNVYACFVIDQRTFVQEP